MCGISGVYNLNGKVVDKSVFSRQVDILRHRGPDDFGIYIDKNVALGHRRLSIIDLSETGRQPMANEKENIFVVFNGEIYNFKNLAVELKSLGHKFKSKTDTEVILHAYEQWGFKCLEKFDGMFAFAIFDRDKDIFFLARDRMGEKPLYYYFEPDKFIFASEIKSILEDKELKREIDPQGIVNYFAFGHSIAPDTIYKGIKKLPPAHFLVLELGNIRIKKYWDPFFPGKKEDRGENYYRLKTAEIFEHAVNSRLVSDVPLGVFLSGGIDSSSVAAVAGRTIAGPLKTFSVGFNLPGGEFNELKNARTVANYLKTEHREIVLDETALKASVEDLVFHFDEPFGDAAAFPVYLMSKFAKQYVSVALTGEGGDEIFGGYRRYIAEKYRHIFFVLSLVSRFVPNSRMAKKMASNIYKKNDLERYAGWISFFSEEMRNELFKLDYKEDPLKMYRQYLSEANSAKWPDKIMHLDQKIILPDGYLEKVDKASMAWGLETRAPLLCHEMVKFANSMPEKYKIKGFTSKYIFRQAVKGLLPEKILHKKKHGFAVPTSPWMKGKLKNFVSEIIFDPKAKSRNYFNYKCVENLPESQLWLILNFELWHRKFIG